MPEPHSPEITQTFSCEPPSTKSGYFSLLCHAMPPACATQVPAPFAEIKQSFSTCEDTSDFCSTPLVKKHNSAQFSVTLNVTMADVSSENSAEI